MLSPTMTAIKTLSRFQAKDSSCLFSFDRPGDYLFGIQIDRKKMQFLELIKLEMLELATSARS